ncbi:MAG TPA: hypothetical protein VGT00_09255 [Methylomirabilota bacterium]|jgi:hypothetical protein|nr:hypothetical protein [Methylomirabilota bacterium]
MKRRRFCRSAPIGRRLLLLVFCLLWAAPSGAGHELPFYPSYYPQEIRLEALPAAAAAPLLKSAKLHAYVGADPFVGGRAPADVKAVESLAGYVVLTFNPASRTVRTRQSRCEHALGIARALSASRSGYVFHPYAVTPLHADYLAHFDQAQKAKREIQERPAAASTVPLATRLQGPWAESLARPPQYQGRDWDLVVEDVTLESLLARQWTGLNGWLEPAWVKSGWFHAYLLQAATLTDAGARQAVDGLYGRLSSGGWSTDAERLEMERQMVQRLGESCDRVVLGYVLRSEYFNTEFSQGVENVAWDSQTGFNSAIFLRTVKLKDFPWNGWLRLGMASRPAAAWNPIAGFSDPAGRLLWAAVGDPALIPAPYSSEWLPNRTTPVAVTRPATSPPISDIELPEDAMIPEPGTGLLREAGKGKSARARVTYRLVASAFHDSTRMTPADAAYAYSFAYRWGARAGGRPAGDPVVEAATAPLRQALVGFRVVKVDAEVKKYSDTTFTYIVPVIDVYVTGGAFDDATLAALATPWSALPWPVMVLMEEAVKRGLAAFSPAEAKRRGVPWLDLARDPKTKEALAALVDGFAAQAYVPPALKRLVTADEAQTRWAALKSFYARRGHFLVTNGPYSLDKWSEREVVLTAFRDFTNPNGVGTYDRFAIPRRAFVTRLTARGDRLEIVPEIERVERFLREYRIVREPLGKPVSDEDRADVPVCRYVIVGADGAVADAGLSRDRDGARLVVNLKGRLKPGAYTALVALGLRDNWVNPEVAVAQFRVDAAP